VAFLPFEGPEQPDENMGREAAEFIPMIAGNLNTIGEPIETYKSFF